MAAAHADALFLSDVFFDAEETDGDEAYEGHEDGAGFWGGGDGCEVIADDVEGLDVVGVDVSGYSGR